MEFLGNSCRNESDSCSFWCLGHVILQLLSMFATGYHWQSNLKKEPISLWRKEKQNRACHLVSADWKKAKTGCVTLLACQRRNESCCGISFNFDVTQSHCSNEDRERLTCLMTCLFCFRLKTNRTALYLKKLRNGCEVPRHSWQWNKPEYG